MDTGRQIQMDPENSSIIHRSLRKFHHVTTHVTEGNRDWVWQSSSDVEINKIPNHERDRNKEDLLKISDFAILTDLNPQNKHHPLWPLPERGWGGFLPKPQNNNVLLLSR